MIIHVLLPFRFINDIRMPYTVLYCSRYMRYAHLLENGVVAPRADDGDRLAQAVGRVQFVEARDLAAQQPEAALRHQRERALRLRRQVLPDVVHERSAGVQLVEPDVRVAAARQEHEPRVRVEERPEDAARRVDRCAIHRVGARRRRRRRRRALRARKTRTRDFQYITSSSLHEIKINYSTKRHMAKEESKSSHSGNWM